MMRRGPVWRKAEVVLGVLLYLALVVVCSLSMFESSTHVSFGQGRIRAAWSDVGTLATLLIAAPAVLYAAYVHWRRK